MVSIATTLAKELRQHYFAAVSYTDSLFGETLTARQANSFYDSTIVAMWGDHGARPALSALSCPLQLFQEFANLRRLEIRGGDLNLR